MALPPIQRVDAEPVFISVMDDTWDHERIARDEQLIHGTTKPSDGEVIPWKSINDHPMTRYWAGDSRGDLATVRDYMRPDKTPTAFRCRRLKLPHWTEAKQLRERGLMVAQQVTCIRYGLVAVDNATGDDGKPIDLGGAPLSDDAIDKVRRLLGDDGFRMLANFIWQCSAEPSPTELFR